VNERPPEAVRLFLARLARVGALLAPRAVLVPVTRLLASALLGHVRDASRPAISHDRLLVAGSVACSRVHGLAADNTTTPACGPCRTTSDRNGKIALRRIGGRGSPCCWRAVRASTWTARVYAATATRSLARLSACPSLLARARAVPLVARKRLRSVPEDRPAFGPLPLRQFAGSGCDGAQ